MIGLPRVLDIGSTRKLLFVGVLDRGFATNRFAKGRHVRKRVVRQLYVSFLDDIFSTRPLCADDDRGRKHEHRNQDVTHSCLLSRAIVPPNVGASPSLTGVAKVGFTAALV